MNKKIVILVVVVLVLIAGGFFWWEKREIKGTPEDYVIRETPEGKIVENKKAGLKVKVPEGWEAKRVEVEEGLVSLSPPITEAEWKNGKVVLPLKKGCMIHAEIVYKKMDFDKLKKEAKYTHYMAGVKSDEFEEIKVNNYPALKNIFDTQDLGPGIGIYVPRESRVYSFYLAWAPAEKERCIQEFDKFLETVLIK